jgi:hypothetical protein
MLHGRPLIDIHLHPARLPGLKLPWDVWVPDFDSPALHELYDETETVKPAAFDAYLSAEGEVAVALPEYSPKVTGLRTVEDMVPLPSYNPHRIKVAANINPHRLKMAR